MSKIIVSGSTAFDNIMQSNTNIKDHLVNKELSNINISYLVSELKKEKGWTGSNIAFNLSLLWAESTLLTSIWKDFEFSDLIKDNVDLQYVHISDKKLTANSYITVDSNDNQITAFYPWAMGESCEMKELSNIDSEYAIVSANHVNIMIKHLKLFNNLWIKTFFDPGQQITQISKDDLLECFKYSNFIILNEYEYEVIKKRSELTDWEMIDTFDNMILTYWVKWSKIFDRNYNIIEIHWVENPDFVDSTWAWDAYRAWLLKWLNDWYSWESSARIWSILSSISTWKLWAQNHFIDWKQFSNLYSQTFWESLEK